MQVSIGDQLVLCEQKWGMYLYWTILGRHTSIEIIKNLWDRSNIQTESAVQTNSTLACILSSMTNQTLCNDNS